VYTQPNAPAYPYAWSGPSSALYGGYQPNARPSAPALNKLDRYEQENAVSQVPAPAHITVNLPADAKIFIEGAEIPSPSPLASDRRLFVTPDLKPGAVYRYTVSAEIVRDGKTLNVTEKVAVQAGSHAKIQLNPSVGPAVVSK
jgi:uncharacterized protein (TIGR03000 family)